MSLIKTIDPLQKHRLSHVFLQYGTLEVIDGAFVLTDSTGVRVQIPLGSVSVLYLEPGVTVTHAAVALAAQAETQLVWVGEAGLRVYSAGRSVSGDAANLIKQSKYYHEEASKIRVAYNMYRIRFGSEVPSRRSVEQLRGIEGARIRAVYTNYANKYGVRWTGRKYDPATWDASDTVNRAISAGNSCLHGLCEAVIIACGYSTALGFIHTGQLKSFVFDVADLYKMDLSVPLAFELVAKHTPNVETAIRHELRDRFRQSGLVDKIVSDLDSIFLLD